MKMIKKVLFLLFLIMLFRFDTIYPSVIDADKFNVYLRMDKQNFFLEEDVILKICVKNRSAKKISIDIYEKEGYTVPSYATFQPVVYDLMGRDAEIIIPYRLESRNISDVINDMKKRRIELAPDEVLIHPINLKDVYNLKPDKKYRVRSFFFPDFANRDTIRSNNELSFRIIHVKRDKEKPVEKGINRKISPPEVILLVLNAEKNQDWKRMLKYLDIEKYINSYSNYIRIYNLANNYEKKRVEEDFVKFLSRERNDYILDFKITRDEIINNDNLAYVDVIMDRFGVKRTHRYKYRYTLEKYENFWLVINLEASHMKGIVR